MRIFLFIVLAAICCSFVLAGSAPAFNETPHYLRSKDAFMADYHWLPKGYYFYYGVTNFDQMPMEGLEYLNTRDAIYASASGGGLAEALELLRQSSQYVFFAEVINAEAQMDASTPPGLDAGAEKSGLPGTMPTTGVRIFSVDSPEHLLKKLAARGLASAVGQTKTGPATIYQIMLNSGLNQNQSRYFYCINGGDGSLVCATRRGFLELMLEARHGSIESQADDEGLSAAAEYYHLLDPSYRLRDSSFTNDQMRLQIEKLKESKHSVPDMSEFMYSPTYSFTTSRYGVTQRTVKAIDLLIEEDVSEKALSRYKSQFKIKAQASLSLVKDQFTEDAYVEEETYLLYCSEVPYVEELKALLGQSKQRASDH